VGDWNNCHLSMICHRLALMAPYISKVISIYTDKLGFLPSYNRLSNPRRMHTSSLHMVSHLKCCPFSTSSHPLAYISTPKSTVTCAAGSRPPRSSPSSSDNANPSGSAKKRNNRPELPKRGFFADVDSSLEVLPVRSSLAKLDVTKRGGRYQSDFIWNTNWPEQLDYEESLRKQVAAGEAEKDSDISSDDKFKSSLASTGTNTQKKGFLSLASKVDLNSLDVDLSDQLKARKPTIAEAAAALVASAGPAASINTSKLSSAAAQRRKKYFAESPPTRLEQKVWERSNKFSKRVVAPPPANPTEAEELEALIQRERLEFEAMKVEIQAWAAGLTIACLAATFTFYGHEVAASYGVGAMGGLVYLRLLNSSVDGLGGAAGAAAAQPRLLIPVILTLGYNRYNSLLAEDVGLTLQLLPMLVGFFTYKGAVVGRQGLALFEELKGPPPPSRSM